MVISEAEKREADRRLTGREPALYAEINRLRASNKELLEAADRLIVGVNTLFGCYERRPENFMSCLSLVEDRLEAVKAAIANARRLG